MERRLVVARTRQAVHAAVAASAAVLLLGGPALAQVPDVAESQTIASVLVETGSSRIDSGERASAAPDIEPVKADTPVVAHSDKQDPPAPEAPPERAMTSLLSNMRIRGYADVGFGRPLQEKLPAGGLQQSKYSFQIADLHLFVTSKLSDEWNFLTEVLFTSDFSNESSAELDRLIVQYNPNKYIKVGFGKFNSAIGYYQNQFHRAKFYQTATGRPLMFTDEDNGGILPVHQVGLTVQGEIPSGALGLHYIGEITNGRAFSLNSHEIQNFADGNNFKAVNGGLFVQPDAAPALDVGFTVYRDTIESDALVKVRETITALHALWVTSNFEFINEVVILNHDTEASGARATSKSFYTQVSRRFGFTRPYGRYEYQDVPLTDPVFGLGDVVPVSGIREVVSAGLHFDVRDFAVVKVQYDHAQQHGAWANGAHAQLAFAF
jgi:hypothetical protein